MQKKLKKYLIIALALLSPISLYADIHEVNDKINKKIEEAKKKNTKETSEEFKKLLLEKLKLSNLSEEQRKVFEKIIEKPSTGDLIDVNESIDQTEEAVDKIKNEIDNLKHKLKKAKNDTEKEKLKKIIKDAEEASTSEIGSGGKLENTLKTLENSITQPTPPHTHTHQCRLW